MISFFFFLFGIVIGSFLNVCIARVPEGMSIVTPRSHCPHCQKTIEPLDNIPVLSWVFLRGRCRNCRAPISPMYPSVELFTAFIFVASYLVFGLTVAAFKWILFACLMIVLTVTDLRTRLLPDAVTWPGLGMGLVFSAAVPPTDGAGYWIVHRFTGASLPSFVMGLLDAVLGAAFGGLLLLGAGRLYRLLRGREGMGLGDAKMMAMVGSFLGLRGTFLTILFGTLLGSLIGFGIILSLYFGGWKRQVAERASRRGLGKISALQWALASHYQLPLGTFLGIAALGTVFLVPR
ncbi:MAG TPA: prepilin peptidase [Methylomirabilota bacterium]|nr:prepilin peptidase [Methylomirabilota bacterium]